MARPSRWNAILQAAAEEFRERGYEAATLESIAQRVGLSKASLYHYIQTKDELLFAVIELPANRVLERAEELARRDAPASARLRELIHLQVDIFARNHPAPFVYLQRVSRPDHPAQFRARDDRYVAAITALLDDGVARREFTLGAPAHLVALSILGVLGWMQHWYEPVGAWSPADVADHLYNTVVGGLIAGGQVGALLAVQPALELIPAVDDTEVTKR
jgi:TetR/AcrR family transcriptional regulator, cholesterol catabolism regulator